MEKLITQIHCEMNMDTSDLKKLAILMLSLLILHTVVSLIAYYLFASSTHYAQGTRLVPTPPGMNLGQDSVTFLKGHRTVPLPVLFSIVSGYLGLGIAVVFCAYQLFFKEI